MSTISNFVLTDAMVEEFYREGYFYAPDFITQETVDAINAEYEEYASEQGNKEWRSTGINRFLEQGKDFPATLSLLKSPEIVKVFEMVLGGPARFWIGMYAVVSPGGKGLEWHQDNQYTTILGNMLNGFIAMDHITQENAGLWIAPRSHRLGLQQDISDDGAEHKRAAEPANGMPCKPMKPGDAVIFHRETLHHSKGNHTDKPRRAFAFQVANHNCRYAETGKLLESDMLSTL